MKVYRLAIAPSESDGEGEDHDEWYETLHEAQVRRGALIRDMDWHRHRFGQDFEITEYTLAKLPRKALALACLNRRWYSEASQVVMAAYKPPRRNS